MDHPLLTKLHVFYHVSNMTVRQAWCVTYQTPVLVDEWWGAAVSPSMYTWMPQPFALGCAGWGPVASSVMEVSWRGFKPHIAHKKGALRCHLMRLATVPHAVTVRLAAACNSHACCPMALWVDRCDRTATMNGHGAPRCLREPGRTGVLAPCRPCLARC